MLAKANCKIEQAQRHALELIKMIKPKTKDTLNTSFESNFFYNKTINLIPIKKKKKKNHKDKRNLKRINCTFNDVPSLTRNLLPSNQQIQLMDLFNSLDNLESVVLNSHSHRIYNLYFILPKHYPTKFLSFLDSPCSKFKSNNHEANWL